MESNKESDPIVIETNSTPNPRAVICQYCKGDFPPHLIMNHENDCANKTLEQRRKATLAREAYRKNYSVAANNNGKPPTRAYQRDTTVPPVNMSPTELAEWRHTRKLERQREYYKRHGRNSAQQQHKTTPRKRYRQSMRVPSDTNAALLAKAVSSASVLLNGKRVQVTISLDWEVVRSLIIQLAPDIAIDKIGLV